MAPASRPGTLRSQWLGQQLRELRDSKGILLKEAAEYLQRDTATLSRYETGFYPIRRPDLLALLDLYGISDTGLREKLLDLSKDVWQKGWWDGYAGDVTGALIDYVWLESRATHIRTFAAMVIPGLLQTPEYAETVIRVNDPDATPEQIKRWRELRLARQEVLGGVEPRVSLVLDEAVLRRLVGDEHMMSTQLRHLAECATRPSVDIRILPLRSGTPSGAGGGFTLFTLPSPFPQVAYTETMAGSIYVESPESERFQRAYDRNTDLALGPEESAALIAAIAEELQ